ncbi:MAG: NTP transferase domain-containing protein [Lachnospiraceae bacterium]|nr:NTP transferase domain-containing protein [Lachnospiraceae bacterium]
MKAITRIVFCNEENEKFFGEGPCQLLHAVERTGSLNAAAQSLGMAYTKALKLLKNAESALGFPLTRRSVGGRSGGGSILTSEGKEWLARYEAYRDACLQANKKLYEEYFPELSGSKESDFSLEMSLKPEETEQAYRFQGTGLVILASGIGKRFGSNKLLADFGGVPMIQRILDTSEGLFEKRVVVTRHEEVQKLCEERNIPVILHAFPGKQDTIRLGMDYMEEHVENCIFTPADQPLLSRDTLIRMGDAIEKDRESMFRTVCEEAEGAPSAFPRWAFERLKQLPEGKGGNVLLKEFPDRVRGVPAGSRWELMDVDTPENMEELLNIWKI